VVVIKDNRIKGVQRVNAALRQGLGQATTGATLGDVARSDFIIAYRDDIVFDVISHMWRNRAIMAVVVSGRDAVPGGEQVVGVISKEHVADSVAESIKAYG
jgi:chloride channel protein, CIC family